MEDFFNSETGMAIVSFIMGALLTAVAWGASALKKMAIESSNKIDDVLIPLYEVLENLKETMDKKEDK